MSLILGLLEPDIEYVESHYERHISLPYHICSQTTSLSYVNTERKAVISPENRQRDTEGKTHGVHHIAVQLVICLLVICPDPVRTAPEIIPDIVPVWNYLESCTERL